MGNGTYIQADANGSYYKIGRSTTDWLNLSSTKATFAADVSSSSATSTASFGTYLGDGSQLTGIETDPFPFTGDAQITGSLDISGSFKVVSATRGTMLNIDANTLAIGPGASVGGGYTAVAIGHNASTGNNYSVSIGSGATTNASTYAVAIGGYQIVLMVQVLLLLVVILLQLINMVYQ